MTEDILAKAIRDASRFIDAAKTARARLRVEGYYGMRTKETGAARRASMDLTRTLAELRKP